MDQAKLSPKVRFGNILESKVSPIDLTVVYICLNKIEQGKTEGRTVTLSKKELEDILGVPIYRAAEGFSRLSRLLGFFVEIEMAFGEAECYSKLLVFEGVRSDLSEERQPQLRLTFTRQFMDSVIWVKPECDKLRSIANMVSNYSQILFLYLERNRYRKEWEVGVDDLRLLLGCHKVESYNQFKLFNDRVLKRCQKEICTKTECRFIYDLIKDGRKVVAVKFTLEDRIYLLGTK